MNRCDQIEARLVLGEPLTPDELAHAGGCAECQTRRAILAEIEGAAAVLAAFGPPSPAEVAALSTARPKPLWRRLALAGAALALALLLLFATRSSDEAGPDEAVFALLDEVALVTQLQAPPALVTDGLMPAEASIDLELPGGFGLLADILEEDF